MQRASKTHYLRHNKGERTPPRIMVLDTESRLIETEPREVQGLRCWVLRYIERAEGSPRPLTCSQVEGAGIGDLVGAVLDPLRSGKAVRLYTHNLSYDLGLTRLPLHLIAQGFELGRHNLASEQPWAYLKRKTKGLWLCDSFSWFPVKLGTLGEILEIRKPALPDEDDSEAAWLARCRADVEILSTALLRAMAEWDRRQLGVWSITGPASGWNTLLHWPLRGLERNGNHAPASSPLPRRPKAEDRVIIAPDPQARDFEREALYSGRRDIWRLGYLKAGPYAEVDLKTAHLAICAAFPLPFRRWAPFDHLDLDNWRLDHPRAGILARVVVNPTTPRYPLRVNGAVLHPVGRFQTVLAGPEIHDARARGELLAIGQGWGYHLGETNKGWAEWCLAVLNDQGSEIDPIFGPMVKGWSRTVPGRWAMLHAREIKSGPSHVADWALEPITIGSPPRKGYRFHINKTWHQSITDQEADDAFPAVLAFIQSHCRLALNKMLDTYPAHELVSCNTEGLWAMGPAEPYLGEINAAIHPLQAQIKSRAQALDVKSPQHLKADGKRLYSGIPGAAVEFAPDRYRFQTWPKLKGQIQRGDRRGYVREERTVNLSGLPVSRWAYQDGHCEPVEASWSPEAGNAILPPREAVARLHGPLRASQHPVLRRMLRG